MVQRELIFWIGFPLQQCYDKDQVARRKNSMSMGSGCSRNDAYVCVGSGCAPQDCGNGS